MEIILGQARRRWSEDEKRALVAETFVDGQTVNGVARRHNISRSMLFGWRKQYREALSFGSSTSTPIGFTAVAIARPEQSEPPTPAPSPAAIPLIELEFGRGVRLRISGAVDPDLAAAVMKALPRR
ncbi:MAG TPA: transposase [Rhizomicrobium sp.]